MSDFLQLHGLCSPWDSPGKNTGVGSISLLQGIFPTQGSNWGLLPCRQILYQLSYHRSPRVLERVAYLLSRGSSQPRDQTGVCCLVGRFFTGWATRVAPKSLREPSLSWFPPPLFLKDRGNVCSFSLVGSFLMSWGSIGRMKAHLVLTLTHPLSSREKGQIWQYKDKLLELLRWMKTTYQLWNITPRQNAVCRERGEHVGQAERCS